MTSLSKLDVKIYRNGKRVEMAELNNLMCPHCNGLLRDPVQVTACGDRFCSPCIDQIKSSGYATPIYCET